VKKISRLSVQTAQYSIEVGKNEFFGTSKMELDKKYFLNTIGTNIKIKVIEKNIFSKLFSIERLYFD